MSGRLSSEQIAEVKRLVQLLHEGEITREEQARLRQWMLESEEAGWLYVQYMNLYAGLHWDTAEESQAEEAVAKGEPERSGVPVLGFLGEWVQHGAAFLSRPLAITLLLSLGLIAAVVASGLLDRRATPPAGPVARVARANDCVGSLGRGYATLSAGTELFEGQRLTLRKGLVEIEFADGARAILESPTAFEFRHGNGGFLQMGRLTATVPPRARGFAVETPLAMVVDEGTDFGVSVAANGTAEAHVFVGEIEVSPKSMPDNPKPVVKRLTVGQATRIRADTVRDARIEDIPASSDEFVRRFPVALAANASLLPTKAAPRLIASVDRRGGVSCDRVPIGRFDGETDPLPSDRWGLRVGALAYSDRLYPIKRIDGPLVGADYVRTFNTDKEDLDYASAVTFTTEYDSVLLMVFIDDRFSERRGMQSAVADAIVSAFAKPGDFVDTGYDIEIDDSQPWRHLFSAYGAVVPTKDASGKPITYTLKAFPPGGNWRSMRSNYVIAAIPEPPRPKESRSKGE